MLVEYASNPAANWKSKDTAVYLVLALTVKGKTGESFSIIKLLQVCGISPICVGSVCCMVCKPLYSGAQMRMRQPRFNLAVSVARQFRLLIVRVVVTNGWLIVR